MDLIDHDSFRTTQGYFRIRAERRRRATRATGRKALFDNQGRRLMRGLRRRACRGRARADGAGLSGGPLRRVCRAGQRRGDGRRVQLHAQVPGLQALQNRATAPSPALQSCERQLVSSRERLLAEADDEALEGWARQAAIPSQEEIDRVRYLIGRVRETLGELEPARAGRARGAVFDRAHQPLSDP